MALKKNGPVVLLILDGWGIALPGPGNAITSAKKPNYDRLLRSCPHTILQASGSAVGLPKNQGGNSEAGHLNIGAGRVVKQDSVSISESIADGTFYKNAAFEVAIEHVKANRSRLHIMGLLSSGNSGHSNPGHLQALLQLTRQKKVPQVFLHLFTDGRDSHPRQGLKLITDLERGLRRSVRNGQLRGEWIASVMGRYYAMDRKKEWSRTERAYNAMVAGKGRKTESAIAAITESYNRDETDEFVEPHVVCRNSKPIGLIGDNDAVLFFNLRSDRARQLAKPFVQKRFNQKNPKSFRRAATLDNLCFVALTDFGPDLDHILTAFPSAPLDATLPHVLHSKRQLYVAESEKYAHVTYFFNGGHAETVAGEKRLVVPSLSLRSYDQQPWMSTHQITDTVISSLKQFDFIVVNFANADMVGHTGNISACIAAIEHIDFSIGRLMKAIKLCGGTLIITADHGNAERKLDSKTKEMYTEHTRFPVPFVLVEPVVRRRVLRKGRLCDIAPTILKLMNVQQPWAMTGKSLF
jgi:2,3-bisphosphoglycerate-independent phosphoglycerate mutase